MKCAIVESPYAGDVERNLRYLRACVRWCVHNGYSPYASHGLLTQPGVLDDDDPAERALGIAAGFEWRKHSDITLFFDDLGWSGGMRAARQHCDDHAMPYHVIHLGGEW